MTAGNYDFTIEQGTDLNKQLTFYTDATKSATLDLSAVTMSMQLRKEKSSIDSIDSLTSDNGRIDKTDAATGVIILIFPDATTTAYNFTEAYYDLKFDTAGTITRVLEGVTTLSNEVTK